jgi:hypothetical protein
MLNIYRKRIFPPRALLPKKILRDGQSIAAAEKLHLPTPRGRVGMVSHPSLPKNSLGDLFYLKRNFNIAAR